MCANAMCIGLSKMINLKITDTAYCVRKLYIIIESGGYI